MFPSPSIVASSNIIFGGELGWKAENWTASDDRVRGGKSQSYLRIQDHHAIFCGNLDIKTLGGAGFASQRTTGDDRHWDLSRFDGIAVIFDANNTDDKTYTFILKDELLPPHPDSEREQSTVSWEYEFSKETAAKLSDSTAIATITIPWNAFKPTYRGRPKSDAEPLKVENIKRMSVMMRRQVMIGNWPTMSVNIQASFFGSQEGDFTLDLYAISGFEKHSKSGKRNSSASSDSHSIGMSFEKPPPRNAAQTAHPSIFRRMFCWTFKL